MGLLLILLFKCCYNLPLRISVKYFMELVVQWIFCDNICTVWSIKPYYIPFPVFVYFANFARLHIYRLIIIAKHIFESFNLSLLQQTSCNTHMKFLIFFYITYNSKIINENLHTRIIIYLQDCTCYNYENNGVNR